MTTQLERLAIAAAALAMTATAANADILHYQAQLRGAARPTAINARGELAAVLDTERQTFDYTVTYKNLSGPVVLAGFKQPTSPPGDPIVTAPAGAATGTIRAVVRLTPAQIRDLNAGRWIFDIATGANPAGEIRGKVMRTSVY